MMNQAKKQAEQLAKDLQSDDPATKAAAEKKLDDLMKQAEKMAGKNQPTKEHMDQLKEMAKDLKSPDKDRREKAEKALDNMMGKENRDKLQEDLKDTKPEEPLPPEIQKKIEDMAKEGKFANLPSPGQPRPGGPEDQGQADRR